MGEPEKRDADEANMLNDAKLSKLNENDAGAKSAHSAAEQLGSADPSSQDQEPKTEAGSELTPLEAAEKVAESVRVECPPELDSQGGFALPKNQQKFLLSAIRTIKRLKDAAPYTAPVDPERLGIPTYFDYIKKPMDLGTIESKLVGGLYATVRAVVDDFNQMVANSIIFNGPDSPVAQMGIALTTPLKRQLGNCPIPEEPVGEGKKRRSHTANGSATDTSTSGSSAPAGNASSSTRAHGSVVEDDDSHATASGGTHKVMHAPGVPMLRRESAADGRPKREIHPPVRDVYAGELRPRNKKVAAELKYAGQVLRELLSRKHENIAYPFLQPVDPDALGVPDYYKIIKEPMDLGTVQTKLQEGVYRNANEFESDVRLMFRNCYRFNPEGTPVAELGHRLEAVFDKRWNDKPVPAPTPPPIDELSDSSDYDEEYDEAGITNPAIKVLEDQLDMMRQQLHKLKREAIREWRDKRSRKKSARAAAGAGARRSSHLGSGGAGGSAAARKHSSSMGGSPGALKDDPTQRLHITYEMKKELSEKISELPEKRLRRVVAIIQESMPQLAASGQEEIELDMDQLQPSTLRQLYDYVVRRRDENGDPAAVAAAAAKRALSSASVAGGVHQKKKKSKPLTEDEQSRQIEEIQNKLRQFEQREGGSGSPAASGAGGTASLHNGSAAGSSPAGHGLHPETNAVSPVPGAPVSAATGGDYDSSSDEDDEDHNAAGGRALVSFSDDSSSEED